MYGFIKAALLHESWGLNQTCERAFKAACIVYHPDLCDPIEEKLVRIRIICVDCQCARNQAQPLYPQIIPLVQTRYALYPHQGSLEV